MRVRAVRASSSRARGIVAVLYLVPGSGSARPFVLRIDPSQCGAEHPGSMP